MAAGEYHYLLPLFVGHPFRADDAETLRDTIRRVCHGLNQAQDESEKRFWWSPEFAHRLDESRLQTVLAKVRGLIQHSALSIFEVTDKTNVNVFFELGMALGMNRSIVLLGRRPFDPPADLRGYRGIEYTHEADLESQLGEMLRTRLQELNRFPPEDREVVYQKLQIDASWNHRIELATDSLLFFAGEVSCARTHGAALSSALCLWLWKQFHYGARAFAIAGLFRGAARTLGVANSGAPSRASPIRLSSSRFRGVGGKRFFLGAPSTCESRSGFLDRNR